MSGLQLAKQTEGDSASSSGRSNPGAPPPIPSTGGPETRDLGSRTQEQYSLAVPGAGGEPSRPPPPPPPPAASAAYVPSAARRAPAYDEEPIEGGRRVSATLFVVLILSALGAGGWYVMRHPGLFAKTPVAEILPVQEVRWPAIQLSGMAGGRAGGDVSSAILNGSLIAVNNRIEGVTLVEVNEEGVVLELGQERKFLRIGESTN